jgi:hypothetical protein
MTEDNEECGICGVDLKDKYSHKLNCNHKFHYECLMKSFQNTPKLKKQCNHCPYCRDKTDYLPLINGLKKVIPGVHCNTFGSSLNESKLSLKIDYSVHCQHILTRGKNKGSTCNKYCFLGYNSCKVHKKDKKDKKDKNLISDSESLHQSTTTCPQIIQDGTSTSPV